MINQIISFSIKNKIFIGLMTIALVIGGIYSMTRIPLDAVPDITNNQVQVITVAPNLGTEDIEQFVTYPVELATSNLPGVTEIRSISRFGLSVVTIVFKDDMGTYLPRQLVGEALAGVKENIPEGFGEPFMAPISTGLGEIYQYTLEVDPEYDTVYDDMELRTIQDWIVKRQMAMLPGVVEVNSFGGRMKQYEVAVSPDNLRSMGLTIGDVFQALENNNQNIGGSYIEKNHQANFIRGEGLARSLQDIRNIVVATIAGKPIFIRDIAMVKFGSFMRYGAFTKDGKGEAVGGIVMMLKGENSNDVIKRVKERIELIQKSLPKGITIKPFLDRSEMIKSTTSTVAENLTMGALIVIFILVLILGNVRGGLIVASTIPLSLLFAFIMMHRFGVWANLMSLGAIDFGILVDGAVIIVESMIFYLHDKTLIGKKLPSSQRDKIAYNSASKMMTPAFFGQLIILIVFLPILALQGIEGKMFIPMAMTFAFAVLGVVVLCLTYIPMMASLFLQPPKTDKKSWGDNIVKITEDIYRLIISWVLNHSRIIVTSAFILLIGAGFIFNRLGAEFIPQLDEGNIAMHIFLKPGSALTDVITVSTRVEKILLEEFPDEVASAQTRIGVADIPTDPMPIDIGDVFIILKPKENWKAASSKDELIEKMEKAVGILPGVNYEFSQPVEMRFNELLTGIREDIAIKLYGEDLDILAEKADEIERLVANIEGVGGLKAEAIQGLPQITIRYDRNRIGQYGLNIAQLNEVVETAFSGGRAGVIYEGEKRFDLVVRLDEENRRNIDDIRNLYVNLSSGHQIPLKEVADISYQPGPMQIGRDNTNRRTYVGINVRGRDIKSLVNEIKQKLDRELILPPGYYIRYGGAFENLERATNRLSLVVPLALGLIFLLVYLAVKSFKQTLMIFMAIPLAAVGGIFSLYFRGMPFSISAGVGFIVLFGVAVLNGLVLVDSFNGLKQEGNLHIKDLIMQGTIRRIRPILLTASTDILGFFPMAVSASAGAEVQQPLATVVIGGLITSTLLTLIVLPVLYKWVESHRLHIHLSKKGKTAVMTIIMLFGIAGLNQASAQEEVITLSRAIEMTKQNYPGIQAAKIHIKKQEALKSSSFDMGATSIYTGKEEVGNGSKGIQTNIGISQSGIDLFGIPAKSRLNNEQVALAQKGYSLTEAGLIRDVSIAWYNAVYAKQNWQLYQQLDSVYANFMNAAELRYHTQQTSKLEYLSASGKYKQLQILIQQAKSNFSMAKEKLNQYLQLKTQFYIQEETGEDKQIHMNDSMKLHQNPLLQYHKSIIKVAEAEWKAEKAMFFPKFNISYARQSVNGISGFYAYEAGVSLPLFFFSQHGKTKAARFDAQIAEKEYEKATLETYTALNEKYSRYQTLQQTLDYYIKEALPLAEEQIEASKLAYRLGSIDYVQFIQNIESAMESKKEYVKQRQEYFITISEIEYFTGRK